MLCRKMEACGSCIDKLDTAEPAMLSAGESLSKTLLCWITLIVSYYLNVKEKVSCVNS